MVRFWWYESKDICHTSGALLKEIDRLSSNRSTFLEEAAKMYLSQITKKERDRRDAEIINRHSDRLNREAEDILGYQQLPK